MLWDTLQQKCKQKQLNKKNTGQVHGPGLKGGSFPPDEFICNCKH